MMANARSSAGTVRGQPRFRRYVDLKPYFPDEAPDYLDGLYRADKAEAENV